MLAITRYVGDKIFIGKDIMLIVSKIEHGRATLAISAPRETKILRGELAGPAANRCDKSRRRRA